MGIGEASIRETSVRETSIGVAMVPKSSNKNLSISIPLAIIVVSMSISISKAVQTIAISQTRISTIQNIGISLSLPLANGMISRVDSEGRDLDLLLIDNGFPSSVGDNSTGANSQSSLTGLVDLGVESRGTEE